MKKAAAGKWIVFAFDRTTGAAKTGDSLNITANLYIDGVLNAVDDTNPTELEDGYYVFDITVVESNGDYLLICPQSTTANIQVIGCPSAVWTTFPQTGDAFLTSYYAYLIVNDAISGNVGIYNSVGAVYGSLELAKGATFNTATDSLEAIRNRGDIAWITGGGMTGAYTVVITIKDDLGATVPTAAVEVWNSNATTFYEKQSTNSSGQVTFNMDAGIYIIKINKTGYTWTNVSQTIVGNTTVTYTGTIFVITPPTDPSLCRVYTYLKDNDGSVPSIVSRSLKIVTLPFDITNYYYSGTELEGIYNSTTGLLYWDVVQGATVKIKVAGFGIDGAKFIIPVATTEEITDLI